nr:7TM GPCR domain containing protein [Haemonchus contortus]
MSGSTKQLHSQLLTVLTIQACLPLTLILGTVGYLVAQMDIYHHPLVEYCTSFLSVPIPAANALVSLYFIGPYRNWIRKRLLRYKTSLVPICRLRKYGATTHRYRGDAATVNVNQLVVYYADNF